MMKFYEFKKSIINDFYDEEAIKYGDKRYNFVAWTTKYDQEIRYQKLLEIGVKDGDTILDFGCGLGDLYGYTKKINLDINYIGVDINSDFIDNALKHYDKYIGEDVKFYKIDSIVDVDDNFDWFLASGSFTVNMTIKDILFILLKGYRKSKKGMAFNFLKCDNPKESCFDKQCVYDSGISQFNPKYMKKLIGKYLKSDVEIIDDYLKEDFTLYVKKEKEEL